jgi:hypothetical protein
MSEIFNVYCDESCHLEHDHQRVMVLGAVWCPLDKVKEITIRLREIKERHDISSDFEVKWTKVSPAKQQFYRDLVDYFFDDDDLHLRVLIVPDKSKLRHTEFNHSHDDWYYSMYYAMLKTIFNPEDAYRVYLDAKDTRGTTKIARLHDVLCEHFRDHQRQVVQRIQEVRSHQVAILQLTDLLVGAISHANRELTASPAKQALIARMRKRSGYDLIRSTLVMEQKVNVFRWTASEEREQ